RLLGLSAASPRSAVRSRLLRAIVPRLVDARVRRQRQLPAGRPVRAAVGSPLLLRRLLREGLPPGRLHPLGRLPHRPGHRRPAVRLLPPQPPTRLGAKRPQPLSPAGPPPAPYAA